MGSILKHVNRWYKSLEGSDHQLLYLFLEITRHCNLSCRHCGSDCNAQPKSIELTTDSWLKIIDSIADQFHPAPTLIITGGEPVLHPKFLTILDKINSRKIRWGMVTNGYQIGSKLFQKLIDYNIYSITVSLDGMKDSHNWLRQRNNAFDRTVETLSMIAASNIPQKDVVTCVNPQNINDLDAVANLLISIGIPAWRLFRIFPAGRAKDNNDLLLTIQQTAFMINWIKENKKRLENKKLNLNMSCEGWIPFEIDRTIRDQPFFCRAGINIASILCDGNITGCSNNDPSFYEGNILSDSLSYVWNKRFKQFRTRSWLQDTYCEKCDHVKDCQGGSIHLWRNERKKPDFCYIDCFDEATL